MTDTLLPTATVAWRAVAVSQDQDDPGATPTETPLAGVRVTLTPSPRKVEVAAPPGAVGPTTYTLREWSLETAADGTLVNPEDESAGPIQIVASDAIDGVTIEWTSTTDAPDSGVPSIVKRWLAPTGSTIDLTTVASVPPSPSPLPEYLAAVSDARAARDTAVMASITAVDAAARAETAWDEIYESGTRWWVGTQAELDAIPATDPDVLYVVSPQPDRVRRVWRGTQAAFDALGSTSGDTIYLIQEA